MKSEDNGSNVGILLNSIYSTLRFIRDVTFATATLICYLPLVFFYGLKFTVTFLATKFYKELSPMKDHDYLLAASFDMDIEDSTSKHLNANLGITCKLNGKVDGESFFRTFVEKVINIDDSKPLDPNHDHIRFHKSITRFWGYWFFKTFPKLKYEDHVTCAVLPNYSSYEEEISKWLKIRYDIKKCPLWGILLIYREESHDTIFAFKIHHLLADGYSLLHILDLLTNTEFKYQVKDLTESKWQKVKTMVKATYTLFKSYIMIFLVPKSPLCPTSTDDEIFITHLTVPVSIVKNIRKENNVRFQSVMLYFISNYVYSVITSTKDKIPAKIAITNSLPLPNHPRNELCNLATGALFIYEKPETKGRSPKEDLQKVNDLFEDHQENNLDTAGYTLSMALSVVPVNLLLLNKSLASGTMSKISGIYIHLIGSEEYLQIFDIECSDVRLFCLPPQHIGLTVTCLTTSNEVRITVVGPKSTFASQQKAVEYSQENFKRIINEVAAYQ